MLISTFPSSISLLCLWHVNQAVLRYCQPTFVRHQQGSEAYQQGLADWNEFFNHWHSIMESPDEKAFDQRVQELERRYLPQYIEEVSYIKANWLDPYKERLVRAWVDPSFEIDRPIDLIDSINRFDIDIDRSIRAASRSISIDYKS